MLWWLSQYATPGVNVGLFCSTPAVAVGRAVPRKVDMEMLFTGHPISAQDALLHGLVSKVVPEDKLEEEALLSVLSQCKIHHSVKGRHLKIPREKRLCTSCNTMEDEANFILYCKKIAKLRDNFTGNTMKIAERICESSRSVIALGKATFYAQMNLEGKEAYKLTSQVMVENLSISDGQEGIKSFIEKKKPVWSHNTNKVH